MATFYSNWDTQRGNYRLRVEVIPAAYDTAGNYTPTTRRFYLEFGSTTFSGEVQKGYFDFDGVRVWTAPSSVNYASTSYRNTSVLLHESTSNIGHNPDGTKTISFTAEFSSSSGGYGPVGMVINSSMALTTIPRASQPSLNVASQALGSPITIYTNRASTAFTHYIYYKFGSQSVAIANGVTDSVVWTLPNTLANEMPNATSGSGSIVVDTYNGATYIGTKAIGFTATVPSSFVPTIDSVTLIGNGLLGGNYVKGKSTVTVKTVASGTYGSTITSIVVTVNGQPLNGSNVTSSIFQSAGPKTVSIVVTDSRGRTASTTRTITVQDYFSPSSSALNVFRSNASGVADENGAYGRITFNYSIASVNNANSRGVLVRYKKTIDSTWTDVYGASPYGADPGSYTGSMGFTVSADTDSPYDVEVLVFDNYTHTPNKAQLPTVSTIMDIHSSGQGVTFGGVAVAPGYSFPKGADINGIEIIALGGTIVEY